MDKNLHITFLQKADLGIEKKYSSITLTVIAIKVYNAMLLNYIQSKIEKVLG